MSDDLTKPRGDLHRDFRCPACGRRGFLFLGSGGWPTCSIAECPNPTLASDVIEAALNAAALEGEA
jgi:hypothetical protein